LEEADVGDAEPSQSDTEVQRKHRQSIERLRKRRGPYDLVDIDRFQAQKKRQAKVRGEMYV
jgi:hypothetical protein